VGIASDALEPRYGTASPGVAMLILSVTVYLWSASHYLIGSRHILHDLRTLTACRDQSA
jgi:hypothetical protein